MTGDFLHLVGTIVDGRYRVDSIAGIGGCGVVYRAFHLAFKAPVALKILKTPGDIPSDRMAERLARFRQEGRILFELSGRHPSIVKVLESGSTILSTGVPLHT